MALNHTNPALNRAIRAPGRWRSTAPHPAPSNANTHLSPDGRRAAYLRFAAGTLGHPADRDVELVVASAREWTTPVHTFALFGGQGTLNVNS